MEAGGGLFAVMLRLLLIVFPALLAAHSISVSTSDAELVESRIVLKLRMPRYEVEHIPQQGLANAFAFRGAHLTNTECRSEDQELLCTLGFAFPSPPGDQIDATVKLARVTVPNHVHILRMRRGPTQRQTVFDRTFESDRLDFRQVSQAEVLGRALRMGVTQLLYQPVLLLLLLLIPHPLAFALGATGGFLVVLPDKFYAPPGFFELATALSIAYLAAEYLFFSQASSKWVIAALIGVLEGAAAAVWARPTGQGAFALGAGYLLTAFLLSYLALRFSRNIAETVLRYFYWAAGLTGVFWSIWVFVKRF